MASDTPSCPVCSTVYGGYHNCPRDQSHDGSRCVCGAWVSKATPHDNSKCITKARQEEARAEAERDGLSAEQTELKVALRGLSDALGINLAHGHGPVSEFTRYVAAVRADERLKVVRAIVAYLREDGASLDALVEPPRGIGDVDDASNNCMIASGTLDGAADHIEKTWGST